MDNPPQNTKDWSVEDWLAEYYADREECRCQYIEIKKDVEIEEDYRDVRWRHPRR